MISKKSFLVLALVLAMGLIVFLITNTASAYYQNFICEDDSKLCLGMNFSCVDGSMPVVWCNPANCQGCLIRCGKECGDMTNCSFAGSFDEDIVLNCSDCCRTYTCSEFLDSEGEEACEKACESKCEFFSQFCNVIQLLQVLSIGVGVVLLTINGLKWIMTDDEQGRDSAKKGVTFVIVGMLLILISLSFINYVYFGEIIC